jgi:hypothetical protein
VRAAAIGATQNTAATAGVSVVAGVRMPLRQTPRDGIPASPKPPPAWRGEPGAEIPHHANTPRSAEAVRAWACRDLFDRQLAVQA